MSVTSNALLRHITIDACLRDTFHKYTLQDLIAACTRAVKENSKTKLKEGFTVSTRTVQLDLQLMRDKKKGYNAPIVVYEQKYYKYKDPGYSIGNANVKQTSLAPLSEVAETLHRYTKMSGMESLEGAVDMVRSVIERKVSGASERISLQRMPKVSGGPFLDVIKDAVIHKKVLSLSYITERSTTREVIFYPLYMKSYRMQWYSLGYIDGLDGIQIIPVDCVTGYSYAILPFPPNYRFNAESYFADIVGVTRPSSPKEDITIRVKGPKVQYLTLNPIHSSQKMTQKMDDGSCNFRLSIIPNDEFYRWVYEMHPYVTVLSPKYCADNSNEFMRNVTSDLPSVQVPEKPKKETKKKKESDPQMDLFSSLF